MKIYKLVCTNKFHANFNRPVGTFGLYSTEAIALDAIINKMFSIILELKKFIFSSIDVAFPQTRNKILAEKVIDFDFASGFADYDPEVYTVKIETEQRKIFDGAVRNAMKALTAQNITINSINEAVVNFLQTNLDFKQNGINLNFYLGNYIILNNVSEVVDDYFFNSILSIEEIELNEMLPDTNVEALKELENLLQSNDLSQHPLALP